MQESCSFASGYSGYSSLFLTTNCAQVANLVVIDRNDDWSSSGCGLALLVTTVASAKRLYAEWKLCSIIVIMFWTLLRERTIESLYRIRILLTIAWFPRPSTIFYPITPLASSESFSFLRRFDILCTSFLKSAKSCSMSATRPCKPSS